MPVIGPTAPKWWLGWNATPPEAASFAAASRSRRPALEHDRARDRALHRAAHALPRDRRPGVQHDVLAEPGHRLARRDARPPAPGRRRACGAGPPRSPCAMRASCRASQASRSRDALAPGAGGRQSTCATGTPRAARSAAKPRRPMLMTRGAPASRDDRVESSRHEGRYYRSMTERLVVAIGGNATHPENIRGTTARAGGNRRARGARAAPAGRGGARDRHHARQRPGGRQDPAAPVLRARARAADAARRLRGAQPGRHRPPADAGAGGRTRARGVRRARVACIVTRVAVDADDEAFGKPTKPIGPFFSAAEAAELQRTLGWTMVEDAGRGWRYVVRLAAAAPHPRPRADRRAREAGRGGDRRGRRRHPDGAARRRLLRRRARGHRQGPHLGAARQRAWAWTRC